MARRLKVKAQPLADGYIFGLREQAASMKFSSGTAILDHTFGYGSLALQLTVDMKDGATYQESIKLQPLVKAWVDGIIAEHKRNLYTLCAVEGCPFFVEPNDDYDGPDGQLAWYVHLTRGDAADDAREDHDALPGEAHTLDWWKQHGPDRVKERFV